ncbi:MAG: polymerase subunit sigma-70 [Gemmataceae bacterium]|nr:polymerase subunit sigma-70 [Gemmataceae bacterium]
MSASVNNPPSAAPPEDPVRAALDDPVVRVKLLAHARAVFRGQNADAEDAVQEVLTRALARRHTFDPATGSAGGWLFGFAANVFQEMFRAERRRSAQQPADQAAWEMAAVAPTAPEADIADERLRAEHHLSRLSTDDRDIVRLRFFDGLSLPDIATQLGISYVAARMRFSRAIRRLQDLAGVGPKEDRS